MFLSTLRGIRVGSVEIVLVDGTVERMGDLRSDLKAKLTVHDDMFFSRLLKSADLVRFARAWSPP